MLIKHKKGTRIKSRISIVMKLGLDMLSIHSTNLHFGKNIEYSLIVTSVRMRIVKDWKNVVAIFISFFTNDSSMYENPFYTRQLSFGL